MSERRWIAGFTAAVVSGFLPLYLWTRLPQWVSDSATFAAAARLGDPSDPQYGYPGHYLQIPLANGLWRLLHAMGWGVAPDAVWLGLCLVGTLAAVVFLGLIAREILQTRTAAWLAAVIFGTSLNMWWQWNGELYALALGFMTAGLFLTLRQRVFTGAALWALAVTCHIDFVLAGPVFVWALWLNRPAMQTTVVTVRRAITMLSVAGISTVALLIVPMWAVGKYGSVADLQGWMERYFSGVTESGHVEAVPEVFRAAKGLLTAFTVAGHYWRDILTSRGVQGDSAFALASGVGLVVLIATAACLIAALWQRRLVVFALIWLVPFQVFFNWWAVPNDAKYHAGSLPAFVLLVTAGLVQLGARLSRSRRYALYAIYVSICAWLNLFGSILPMQSRGLETRAGTSAIRELDRAAAGGAAMLSCTDSPAMFDSGIENFRVKRIWTPDPPVVEQTIRVWVGERIREGKVVYLLGRWCYPEEWVLPAHPPFDQFFLNDEFEIVRSGITGIPVAEVWETNPFSWRRGDVFRLVPRQ